MFQASSRSLEVRDENHATGLLERPNFSTNHLSFFQSARIYGVSAEPEVRATDRDPVLMGPHSSFYWETLKKFPWQLVRGQLLQTRCNVAGSVAKSHHVLQALGWDFALLLYSSVCIWNRKLTGTSQARTTWSLLTRLCGVFLKITSKHFHLRRTLATNFNSQLEYFSGSLPIVTNRFRKCQNP